MTRECPRWQGCAAVVYPPEVIRKFCERIGVSKRDGFVDVSLLDYLLREHLNSHAPRRMAVLASLFAS